MEESTSKEKILKRIRHALINQTENPFQNIDLDSDIYTENKETLDVMFAAAFDKVAGKFIYCENEQEFRQTIQVLFANNNWSELYCLDESVSSMLEGAKFSIISSPDKFNELKIAATRCEYLIARLGSIMVSSAHDSGRRLNVYPEIHIVVAYTSQLVYDVKTAIRKMKAKYGQKLPSMISVITGPSRTADIEKTLVMGAHGPKDLYLFLIENGEPLE
jgi:L-lactate dehydrogenase complex protein LldG